MITEIQVVSQLEKEQHPESAYQHLGVIIDTHRGEFEAKKCSRGVKQCTGGEPIVSPAAPLLSTSIWKQKRDSETTMNTVTVPDGCPFLADQQVD